MTDSSHQTDRLDFPERVQTWTVNALCVLSIGYVVLFLFVSLSRIGYPFELEWQEGAMLDHVARILNGQLLYVRPTIEFVPYIYAPLYFYVTAGLASIFELGFAVARSVSLAAALGIGWLTFALVRRETRQWKYGLMAIGLFAATFHKGGAWFDLARVDSLFIFLTVLAAYLFTYRRSRTGTMLCAVAISTAFYTKQSAAVPAVLFAAYLLVCERRRFVSFVVPSALLMIGGTVLLNRLHDGWYFYFLFELPSSHRQYPLVSLTFWTRDVLRAVPVAALSALVYLWQSHRDSRWRERLPLIVVFVSFIIMALLGRIHQGGWYNVLIPMHLAFSILFALGIAATFRISRGWAQRRRSLLGAVVLVLCALQFGRLFYSPAQQIPTDADRRAGYALLERIRAYEGEVFVPHHGFYTRMVGKPSFAHQMAIRDVTKAGDSDVRRQLQQNTTTVIGLQRFDAIFIDRKQTADIVDYAYEPTDRVFKDTAVFFPVTGNRVRPEIIYEPK